MSSLTNVSDRAYRTALPAKLCAWCLLFLLAPLCVRAAEPAAEPAATEPAAAEGGPQEGDLLVVPDATARSAAEMKPYTDIIENSTARFEMVPIPAGTLRMGSPEKEEGREEDEGPQFDVTIEPFWMGQHEVTWDAYEVFMLCTDIDFRRHKELTQTERAKKADAISHPTKPYTDMTFGMGKKGYPAICMTQLAARMYCKWLSAKTGRYYRLPTEAEWEYACRAGTTSAYSFGDDAEKIDDYAWHIDNSDEAYHPVGQKKPNPWGLYDMHGNVAEWVLDQHDPQHYAGFAGKTVTVTAALAVPTTLYPRVVRGGSWDDDIELLRSAARAYSSEEWKEQDPQFPQSIWYHTDALHVGFRLVRPLRRPSPADEQQYWDAGTLMPEEQSDDKRGCSYE